MSSTVNRSSAFPFRGQLAPHVGMRVKPRAKLLVVATLKMTLGTLLYVTAMHSHRAAFRLNKQLFLSPNARDHHEF